MVKRFLKPCHLEERSDNLVCLIEKFLAPCGRGAVVGESIEPYKCGEG